MVNVLLTVPKVQCTLNPDTGDMDCLAEYTASEAVGVKQVAFSYPASHPFDTSFQDALDELSVVWEDTLAIAQV